MSRRMERLVRVAIGLPVSVVVVSVAVVGEVRNLAVIVGAVLVGLVLALIALVRWRDETPPGWVPAVFGTAGLVTITVVLVLGLDTDPRRLTLLHALVVVAAAFGTPARARLVLAGVTVAAVAVATVADPRTSVPTVVVAQTGGTALLAWITLRVVGALEAAVEAEAASRRSSELRAASLTSLLQLQRLDPETVRAAVLRGAEAAGLAEVDLIAPEAAGSHRDSRRIETPVLIDGEVVSLLVGRVVDEDADEDVRDAVSLLAVEAGRAFGRAARHAAEAATVAELRRLDQLAHDVASTVSHELRTPLTVVDGLSATLHDRWDELSPERRADLTARIAANAERLAAIVRALAGPEAFSDTELDVDRRSVALQPMVEAIIARLEVVLDTHPVRLEVAPVTVVADPDLLDRVLENLVANAAIHTPSGTPIRVVIRRAGRQAEIAVEDDGPGIAPEDLPHLFDRFFRAGESTTRATGGLGLGLPFARQVVRAHDGVLSVRSAAGAGTRFVFRLPLV